MTDAKKRATERRSKVPSARRYAELEFQALHVAGIPGPQILDPKNFQRRAVSPSATRENFRVAWETIRANWFATHAHEIHYDIASAGFKPSAEASAALFDEDPFYDWKALNDDLFQEFMSMDNAVALWRRLGETSARSVGTSQAPGPKFPFVTVLNCKDIVYTNQFSNEVLTIPKETIAKLGTPDEVERDYGKLFGDVIRGRKPEVKIVANDPDKYDGWDHAAVHKGKRGDGLVAPSIFSVLDDLDFIELTKIADWNAAWMRKDIVRMMTRGYKVDAGTMAGQAVNHMKPNQRKKMAQGLKDMNGPTNIAANFDHDLRYIHFPKEFFGMEVCAAAVSRLLNYGGMASMMLLGKASSDAAMIGYLATITRARIKKAREKVGDLLKKILVRESFLGSTAPDAEHEFSWSNAGMYNVSELMELVKTAASYASASNATTREMLDLNDAVESKRTLTEHENPLEHTPVWEPQQGMAAARTGLSDAEAGGGGGEPLDEGGRPPGT